MWAKPFFLIHSHLPWFEVFYKLLNNLADYLTKGQVCCAFFQFFNCSVFVAKVIENNHVTPSRPMR